MKRSWNWWLAGGFLLSLAGLITYFDVFARFPVTRDFPWANLLIFFVALMMLAAGLWRAFGQPERYRGKIYGPVLTVLGVAVFGLFIFYVFFFSYWLPESKGAPAAGDRMPDFTLPDQNGQPFQLSQWIPSVAEVVTEDAPEGRWVLLIFYRGHW